MALSRRGVLATGIGAGLGVSGCGMRPDAPVQQGRSQTPAGSSAPGSPTPATTTPGVTPTPTSSASRQPEGPSPERPRLIGDGSTSDTGPQPHQPRPTALKVGETPPQFVVLSWDGAGETDAELFSRFRALATELRGSMTFFLSGIYTLPQRKRKLYAPPGHPVGASDIGFLSEKSVHRTIRQVGLAWTDGHEIGTHFNGHFCGANGVERWSPKDWDSEIDQAVRMVTSWKTTTGFDDLPALPFDYRTELIGARTPCLEGQHGLLRSKRVKDWKYDTSGTGTQVWPTRFDRRLSKAGLWNVPMQQIPFPGHDFEVLSMDYNIMYNQSRTTQGDRGMWKTWRRQAKDAFLAGFRRAYEGNRAPLIIGNHFEQWNGGIYMDALTDAARSMARHEDVRFVSFRQLVAWLEVQTPAVLKQLQSLPVGTRPH